MEKLKTFFKIPALCCTTGLFIVLLIALIVMSSQSYSRGTYVGEETVFGAKIKIEMNLKDDSNVVAGITSIVGGATEFEENEMKYKITNGEIFTSKDNGENYNRVGKIDAYKISVSSDGYSMTLTNKSATAARATIIVFMVISLAGAIASGIYTILSKKNI